jgi:hypothetical protein
MSICILRSLIAVGLGLSSNLVASSICAMVNDPTGRPLRSAVIVVVNLLTPTANVSTGVAAAGKGCVEHLPDGLYSVEAGSPGSSHLKVKYYPVRVIYPENINLSFQLPIGEVGEGLGLSEATLSGTLTDAGDPAEGIRICLFQDNQALPLSCTVTNDLGQYALVVAPGAYRLEVSQRQHETQIGTIDLSEPGYYRNRVSLPARQK